MNPWITHSINLNSGNLDHILKYIKFLNYPFYIEKKESQMFNQKIERKETDQPHS
jgi:hypothetical protein